MAGRRHLVGGVIALAVALGIGRFAYTPILPSMQRAVQLAPDDAGLLASANYAGYLIGALLISRVVQRFGRAGTVRICLLGIVFTTALMASTADFAAWSLTRFFSGVFSAGVLVSTTVLVLRAVPNRERVARSGWLIGGIGHGIVLSGAAVLIVDPSFGWRGDWLSLAAIAAALTVLSLCLLPSGKHAPVEDAPVRADDAFARHAPVTPLVIAYLLEGTGYVVTGTFLASIVERASGQTSLGSIVWIVVGLAVAPSCIAWSWLAGRLGTARVLAVAYLVQALGIALPLFGDATWIQLVTAVLFGGTFLAIVALTLGLAGRHGPDRAAGLIAILTAVFGLGQIIGPVVAGAITVRTGSFNVALGMAAAVIVVGAGLMAYLGRFDVDRQA